MRIANTLHIGDDSVQQVVAPGDGLRQRSNATRDGLKETALAVARTMADMPQVKRGLEAPPQMKGLPIIELSGCE
jgi:sensor histidine kinase regulating citrate/malate metabolism